jgi:hypothetical protein
MSVLRETPSNRVEGVLEVHSEGQGDHLQPMARGPRN